MKRLRWIMVLITVTLLAGAALAAEGTYSAPRMTPDELKALLENPDLLIVDVRVARDWNGSDVKIKGAERRDPMTEEWADQMPRDKIIVLYCT